MSIKARTRLVKTALAACCAMLLASGCTLIPKEEEVLKPPLVKPAQEQYDVYEVTSGRIVRQIKGTGTLESTLSRYEEFSVAGKIADVKVKVGDMVKKGDPLISLDIEGLDLNVKEKERDWEVAQLELEKAKQTHDAETMKIKLLELEIARSKLDDAQKQLAGKTLTAGMDGVVTFMDEAKPGDMVQLNETYVKIDDPTHLRLAYSTASMGDLQTAQVGMKADITFREQKLTGKVVQTPSTAPKTENKQLMETYNKTLYVALDSVPEKAEIGAPVEINIVTHVKDDVIKIPTQYLGNYLGRYFVKVLEGESIQEVDVEKGLESLSPAEVEIVKGLKAGQKIISIQ